MHTRTRRTTALTGLVALLGTTVIAMSPDIAGAGADLPPTVVVTTTSDTVDADLGDDICADAGGQCSLRAALQQHGGLGDPTVVVELPTGHYALTIATPDDAISTAGSLDVYGDVILTGHSALDTVIDANDLMSAIHVGTEGLLQLEDVTVTGGRSTTLGGAATVEGQLFAERARFVGNVGGTGGAIGVNGGYVSLDRSEVTDNHAPGGGGGIAVETGTLLLNRSTVATNTTGTDVTAAHGGGIDVIDGATHVNVQRSTVAGNEGPEVVVIGAAGAAPSGVTLERSILGDADPTTCVLPAGRTVVSEGDNLITDVTCGIGGAGDMVGLDALLSPLGFFGGPTRTRYPLPGSPAVDTVADTGGVTDQRGALRPIDGDGVGGAAADAGAVERDSSLPDVPHDHPFFGAIAFLRHDRITTGYADGTFKPSAPITRQAFAAFLYRYVEGGEAPPCVLSPFPDVPESHPFCGAITWMALDGITTGFPDLGFHPTDPITRQAMAAFLYRLTMGTATQPCEVDAFSDVATAHPFCPHITWMVGAGVTNGYADSTFKPSAPVTRQAMAAFLQRLRGVTAPGS